MKIFPPKQVSILLASALLGTALLGAGCVTKLPTRGDAAVEDVGPATDQAHPGTPDANLSAVPPDERQRVAEGRLRMFIDALDRGDASAARALLTQAQRRDTEFLNALPPSELRSLADWYRTYRFAGIWENRAEFRPTQERPGEPARSLFVQFVPGDEGIMF